jgi:hypothetical protein
MVSLSRSQYCTAELHDVTMEMLGKWGGTQDLTSACEYATVKIESLTTQEE